MEIRIIGAAQNPESIGIICLGSKKFRQNIDFSLVYRLFVNVLARNVAFEMKLMVEKKFE